MNVVVNKDSIQTHKYWYYVVGKIIKSTPIHAGDNVRFTAKEDSSYFPEFIERPVILKTLKPVSLTDSNSNKSRTFRQVSTLEQEVDQAADEDSAREGKIDALKWFTERKLDGICALRSSKCSDDGPIVFNFVFKIIDPIKIYREAKRLDIKILRGKNLSKHYTEFPSEWLDNSSCVRWGISEIEFSSAPLEKKICREAFKLPPGKEINCYDLMEKIEPVTAEDDKKSYDAVYKSIKRINKSVKDKTGKVLFRWTNRAFLRLA